MTATLILSTDGNQVTFSTGFNDVPKHHITIKRKSIQNSYPNQVKDQIKKRIYIKRNEKRIIDIKRQAKLMENILLLYLHLNIMNLLDILFEIQQHEK